MSDDPYALGEHPTAVKASDLALEFRHHAWDMEQRMAPLDPALALEVESMLLTAETLESIAQRFSRDNDR